MTSELTPIERPATNSDESMRPACAPSQFDRVSTTVAEKPVSCRVTVSVWVC